MKMTVFAVMSLILFSNCSSNRMGIFDCFRKKKDKEWKLTEMYSTGISKTGLNYKNSRLGWIT